MTKYLAISERLLERIGELMPGDPLPQERELAEEFGVSRATIRQALKGMADDGKIYSVRGRGTFVADGRISKPNVLVSFTEDMLSRDLKPETRLLYADQGIPTPRIGRALELGPEDETYRLGRLRLADGYPMCLEEIHLPVLLFPKLLHQELTGSLYTLLASRYRTTIVRADQRLSAVALSRDEATLLGVSARTPALQVRRVSCDARGKFVEYAQSLYRADRYDFEVSSQRA